jgi:hypothetical protein
MFWRRRREGEGRPGLPTYVTLTDRFGKPIAINVDQIVSVSVCHERGLTLIETVNDVIPIEEKAQSAIMRLMWGVDIHGMEKFEGTN